MDNVLLWFGRLGGLTGVGLAAVAGAMRIAGHYTMGSFQLSTLLLAGIGGMAFGSFCLLAVLTARPARHS